MFGDLPKNIYLIEKSEKSEELHNSTTFCDTDECNQNSDISIK